MGAYSNRDFWKHIQAIFRYICIQAQAECRFILKMPQNLFFTSSTRVETKRFSSSSLWQSRSSYQRYLGNDFPFLWVLHSQSWSNSRNMQTAWIFGRCDICYLFLVWTRSGSRVVGWLGSEWMFGTREEHIELLIQLTSFYKFFWSYQ